MKFLKYFSELNEDITIPVNIGDTIYQGRFKNKKKVIKTITKDELGMPEINGQKVVNFRTTPPKKTSFKWKGRWKKKS